ncbi:MAG: hypothetical protein LBK25_03540, partial [Treponema sp.]|nr:hypothetical protein [Treponema sp.]
LAPDIIELAPDIIKLPKYIIKLGTYTDSPVCTRCALIGGFGGFSASGLKAFPQVLGYVRHRRKPRRCRCQTPPYYGVVSVTIRSGATPIR